MKNDIENLTKALHSAGFLREEIKAVYSSDNALLSLQAYELLEQAAEIEKRLKRLLSAVDTEESKKLNP